ncbi:GIY-YIG nuclease family protein [Actinomadura roseirufa]|uniref:GIY-YIG nuclease family protein n=1 Tax=Actinomadura roseirufa TaxID=2094049 RepID=UPI00104193A1|nr:GIY-YIG nuclease family protein [Actinomadura roseirufa]
MDTEVESVTVRWTWCHIGNITVDHNGKLLFPPGTPAEPGIYRMLLSRTSRHDAYIGEAQNLRRRFSQYRSPGKNQTTNRNLNELLLAELTQGNEVILEIAANHEAELSYGPRATETLDLTLKANRTLLERAAEASSRAANYRPINK